MEANKVCQHLASSKSGDYSVPKEVCCLSSVFVGLQRPTHLQPPPAKPHNPSLKSPPVTLVKDSGGWAIRTA